MSNLNANVKFSFNIYIYLPSKMYWCSLKTVHLSHLHIWLFLTSGKPHRFWVFYTLFLGPLQLQEYTMYQWEPFPQENKCMGGFHSVHTHCIVETSAYLHSLLVAQDGSVFLGAGFYTWWVQSTPQWVWSSLWLFQGDPLGMFGISVQMDISCKIRWGKILVLKKN